MKIAVPLANGVLSEHFGHCEEFALVEVDAADKKIVKIDKLAPPAHQPGAYPQWLGGMGVTHIIAGGIGGKAIQLFNMKGIEVHSGAPVMAPEELVASYLKGNLSADFDACDHSGQPGCSRHNHSDR